jgi:hypothetical protein
MKQWFIAAMVMAAGASYADVPALYDCIYFYRMEGTVGDKEISEGYDCILRIGEEKSKFYDYSSFRLDSVLSVPDVSDEVVEDYRKKERMVENYFDQTVVQSLPDGVLKVFCDMAPHTYRYEEEIPLMKWDLKEDTDTICGYVCRKGVAHYGGMEWTAWFSEEIPLPFGPWKVVGLPGLVLKAYDSASNHTFEAVAFRKASGGFSEKPVPNSVSIDRDKFVERKNRYDIDPYSTISPESITDITVREDKSVFVNGVRVRQRKNGGIPLEYSESELKKIGIGNDSGRKGEVIEPEIKVVGVGSVVKK